MPDYISPLQPWKSGGTMPLPSQASPDPLAEAMRRERDEQTRHNILNAQTPDQMAKATTLARQLGAVPADVEGIVDQAEKARRANNFQRIMQAHPVLGDWAASDPRAAVAASDDHKPLGILGTAWQTFKQTYNPVLAFARGWDEFDRTDVGSNTSSAAAPLLAVAAAIMGDKEAQAALPSMRRGGAALASGIPMLGRWATSPLAWAADISGVDPAKNGFLTADKYLADTSKAWLPKGGSWTEQQVLGGISNVPGTAASLGVGLGARAAGFTVREAAALSVLPPSIQQGGESYFNARNQGVGKATATLYGILDAGAEAGGEYLSSKAFIKSTEAGDNIVKRWIKEQIPDLVGEEATTVAENTTAWLFLPENKDKSIGQLASEMPEGMAATAIQTLVGGGLANVTISGLEKALGTVAERRRQSVADSITPDLHKAWDALREKNLFSSVEKVAAESGFRKMDPEGFAKMMGYVANENDVHTIFVPGEAIRAYQQSDTYDQFEDPFQPFQAQIDEAAATGGDVVLPADFALGTLPGTAAWSAVKDDLRLRPGGMSSREADDFNARLDDVMGELTQQRTELDQAQANERDNRSALVERVTKELQNAGFTPTNAALQAELIAQRTATRAARLGREMQPGDFDTRIAAVLPPALAQMQQADRVDLVINAMRKGKGAASQSGKSLLEWISGRGGINDTGGDIASMGGDKWHLRPAGAGVDKRGRKKGPTPIAGRSKLIRDYDPRQATMGGVSGQGDYGLDTTMRAAVEAGYFPHLSGTDVQSLDTEEMLAAIRDELAGRPTYAEEAKVDDVRLAADELRQMLEDQGRDPSGMSDTEIRKAIKDQIEQSRGDGAVYDQMPDTLEIDGVQRPTRNSEGMPLAGSEEGVRAFWKWFGDSKVVDEEGRPLVVYHGTNQPIDQFSPDRLGMSTRSESANYGFFFTSDPYVAGLYANSAASKTAPDIDTFERQSEALQKKVERLEKQAVRTGNWDAYEAAMLEWETLEIDTMRADDSGQNIVPVYLAISDPVVMDFEGEGILKLDGGFGTAIKNARDGGRGGLFLKNIDDTPGETRVSDHYVTFSPTQIKSINNRGSFDPVDARILYQTYGEGPRGRIELPARGWGTGPATISLFQARNPSTLLHELGHQWLEELRYDASLPDAPEQLKADWQTVQDWFAANGHAIGDDGIIPVEAHELWARGSERYLMEGKAPSSALTRIFETLRSWMLSVYKTVEALRAPITPEIREVFDRLIATDDEIQQQAEALALQPLFKDAATIGMTGPEYEAYTGQVQGARDKANSSLLAKTMASIKRRVTKAFNDERKGVWVDEAERLDNSPILKSLRMMKDAPVDVDWLRDRMGQDVTDLLPKRVPPIWKEGGANPDSLAEMAGFSSGQQMIEVLIGAEKHHREQREGGDQRTLRARMIDTAADAEMQRRHGDDPFSDGSIESEAIAAVNNELAGEVLATEIRLLSRRTGQRPTPYKIARDWARQRVRGGVVANEASPSAIQRHARAVAKAGRDAEKAILAGKPDEALRFKQQQMLSSALLAEAKAAYDEVTSAQERMAKITKRKTMKSVDQEYLEQAHALLDAVDLGPRSQKSIDRQGKWESWSAAREAEGYEIVVPPSFEATINRTHFSRLSVENLLGLDEAVKQVMHLGRLKQTLLDNQDEREWDEIFDEAVDGASNIKGPPPQSLMEPGWWDSLKGKAASIDAALLKMETIFDWLDGGNPNGVFNRLAFRPVADAQAREQDMLKDYYARIKALFEAVPAETASRWQDKVVLPFTDIHTGQPMEMNRHKVISMALNIGNEGNLQRLSDGYQINQQALQDYLNETLTADEWQFVQGVWDTIDTLWPKIEGLEKRVNGVAPEKIAPRAFVTPHGPMRGGYFPAIYDASRDYKAEENRGKESDLFEGRYTRATTRASSTKERADKVKRPILLDLGIINRHLGEVIHDITHREPVMQANRLLSSERVMRAVDEALGQEIRGQFRHWVKFVANSWAQERAGNEGFGRWISKLRANATVVGMGLRATTMVTQIAGYSNSIEVVGETAMAKALARFSSNPAAAIRDAMEKSGEVRHRMDTLDRDIRTELARVASANPATKLARKALDAKRFMFHGIGYMDMLVSVPTWMAGYSNALEAGMSEQDSIYAGDKAVRQSQGAGGAKDLAAIQRGTGKHGEALKLFTMFYSYFSAQYQRERTLVRDVLGSDGRKSRSLPKLASRAFFLLVLPPLLTELLRASVGAGAGPDDDEWWAEWVMRKMLANAIGPIPLARDLFEPTWNGLVGNKVYNPSITPLQRAMDAIVKAGQDAGKIARGDETKHATKDAMEAVGYVTGLVPGQAASAVQFLVDVANGNAHPQSVWDWVEGISTGKLKD